MNNKDETKQLYDAIAEKSFNEWFDNPVLLPTLKKFIENLPPGPEVLDLGCGTGGESKRLVELGAQVTGIDFSEKSIEYARDNVPGVRFVLGDIIYMECKDFFFDGVVDAGTLFHFNEDEQNRILSNIVNILKPGGILLSYYPEGDFEGMQDMDVSGKRFKRYARTMKKDKWIQQVMSHGFAGNEEHEFNMAPFTCLMFYC